MSNENMRENSLRKLIEAAGGTLFKNLSAPDDYMIERGGCGWSGLTLDGLEKWIINEMRG